MSRKKPTVESLILEVTRRCNMACPHCLRGDAETIDMDIETAKRAVSRFSRIENLFFTGGEPLLNLSVLEQLLVFVKEENIIINSFGLITNGTIATDAVFDILDGWYAYCHACRTKWFKEEDMSDMERLKTYMNQHICDENIYDSNVELSLDSYHDVIPKENLDRFLTRSYFDAEQTGAHMCMHDKDIRPIGRAKDWNERKLILERYDFTDERECGTFDNVYVNVKGDVLEDCNISYELQETYRSGNINDDALFWKEGA